MTFRGFFLINKVWLNKEAITRDTETPCPLGAPRFDLASRIYFTVDVFGDLFFILLPHLPGQLYLFRSDWLFNSGLLNRTCSTRCIGWNVHVDVDGGRDWAVLNSIVDVAQHTMWGRGPSTWQVATFFLFPLWWIGILFCWWESNH